MFAIIRGSLINRNSNEVVSRVIKLLCCAFSPCSHSHNGVLIGDVRVGPNAPEGFYPGGLSEMRHQVLEIVLFKYSKMIAEHFNK